MNIVMAMLLRFSPHSLKGCAGTADLAKVKLAKCQPFTSAYGNL